LKNILFFLKKNIFIILSSIFFALSVTFAYVIFDTMGYFGSNDNTSVGTIAISNYDESQYSAIITSETNSWRQEALFTIQYHGYEYEFDLDLFSIQIVETINNLTLGENNPVIFTLSESSKTSIINSLSAVFSENIISEFDSDAFFNEMLMDMGAMNILKHYRLENYLSESTLSSIIDTVTIDFILETDVDTISSLVQEFYIEPNSRFSLLDTLTGLELTNNQLSIIASGIQKITWKTPFSGYIFSQNSPLPDRVQEGMNVKILQTNNYDFTFFNALDMSYQIQIEKESNTSIKLTLIGSPFVADYSVSQIDEIIILHESEYSDNDLLNDTTPGIIIIDSDEETIYRLLIEPGQDGVIVCYTRTIILPDLTEYTEILYREIYYPTTAIYQENIVEK